MTLAELRAAKQKKEEMLKNSIKSFTFMDPTDLTSTAGSEGMGPLPTVTVK